MHHQSDASGIDARPLDGCMGLVLCILRLKLLLSRLNPVPVRLMLVLLILCIGCWGLGMC